MLPLYDAQSIGGFAEGASRTQGPTGGLFRRAARAAVSVT